MRMIRVIRIIAPFAYRRECTGVSSFVWTRRYVRIARVRESSTDHELSGVQLGNLGGSTAPFASHSSSLSIVLTWPFRYDRCQLLIQMFSNFIIPRTMLRSVAKLKVNTNKLISNSWKYKYDIGYF